MTRQRRNDKPPPRRYKHAREIPSPIDSHSRVPDCRQDHAEDHTRSRRRARPQSRGIPAPARYPRPRTADLRARHLLSDVERALLVQIFRVWLKTLSVRPQGHSGSGENAGVVDLGDAAVAQDGSHSHPSYIGRSRARRPASAASCATSSRWSPPRASQMRCASARQSCQDADS
jgi:hypothetical protein